MSKAVSPKDRPNARNVCASTLRHGAGATSHEPNDPQFKGQTAQILALLREHKHSWVPARELVAIASQYSSRIYSARAAGFEIINRVETTNGVKRGFFMLVSEPRDRSVVSPGLFTEEVR